MGPSPALGCNPGCSVYVHGQLSLERHGHSLKLRSEQWRLSASHSAVLDPRRSRNLLDAIAAALRGHHWVQALIAVDVTASARHARQTYLVMGRLIDRWVRRGSSAARARSPRAKLRSVSTAGKARLWAQKWRWYERNSLPWNRARIHSHFMRREAFTRWPLHGNVLESFAEGRLEIGPHTLLEPHVWLTAPGDARIRIGAGSFLNIGVMVAAESLVEIGDHCMFANGCFVTDADHRFDDPHRPITWQGFTSKGPTRVRDNVWCGAHVVVTSGVTIGERCVIGANSVVTHDIEPYSIAAGAPARVLRTIEYK